MPSTEFRVVKRKGQKTVFIDPFNAPVGTQEQAVAVLHFAEDRQIEMAELAAIEESIPFEEKSTNEISYTYHRDWEGWDLRVVSREVTEWREVSL
jgi:hypothetical protein